MTPPRLLGRVSAINIMSYGARPIGAALGAMVGGLYGAEACLYLAVAIFGAQALVILMSPAVSLARQPEMVGEPAGASGPVEQRRAPSAVREAPRACACHSRSPLGAGRNPEPLGMALRVAQYASHPVPLAVLIPIILYAYHVPGAAMADQTVSTIAAAPHPEVSSTVLQIAVLAALAATGTLATNILLPSLPQMAASLHVSSAAVTSAITVFLAVFALGQLAVGPISDRYGRRWPVLTGFAVFLRRQHLVRPSPPICQAC